MRKLQSIETEDDLALLRANLDGLYRKASLPTQAGSLQLDLGQIRDHVRRLAEKAGTHIAGMPMDLDDPFTVAWLNRALTKLEGAL